MSPSPSQRAASLALAALLVPLAPLAVAEGGGTVPYELTELALGTESRSGVHCDIWETLDSPLGEADYPELLWGKRAGEIDREVAEHWKL